MINDKFITKDTVIKILIGIVSIAFSGLSSWLLVTVYNNSTIISKLSDKTKQEQAQWKAINELRQFHYQEPHPH